MTSNPASKGRAGLPLIAILVMLVTVIVGVRTLARGEDAPETFEQQQERLHIPASRTDLHTSDFWGHHARYQVQTDALVALHEDRFPQADEHGFHAKAVLSSAPVDREGFEYQYAELGWTWSEGLLHYACSEPGSNPGSHEFWHDPSTGQTYQMSTGWPEEAASCIPAEATEVTRSPSFSTRRARYHVTTADLYAKLTEWFPQAFDRAGGAKGTPSRESFEEQDGGPKWTWSEALVHFDLTTPSGRRDQYWHDATTGLTYQASSGW